MTGSGARLREAWQAAAEAAPAWGGVDTAAAIVAGRRRAARRRAGTAGLITAVALLAGAGSLAIQGVHDTSHRIGMAGPVEHSSIPPVIGRAAMVLTRSDGLYAVDAAGQDRRRFAPPGLDPGGVGAGGVALSRDGTQVAVTSSNHRTLLVVDLPTGRVTAYPERYPLSWLRWSPDGSRLLVGTFTPDPATSVLTLATGQMREILPGMARYGYVYWRPDSKGLLADLRTGTSTHGEWGYVDLTGRVVRKLPKLAPYVAGYGLSEDGRSFLALDVTDPSVSSEGTLHAVDPETGAVRANPSWEQLGGSAGHETWPFGWIGPHEFAIQAVGYPFRLEAYDITTGKLRTVLDWPGVGQLALPGQ